jgi:Domain of unknown function (DUF1735)
MKENKIKIIFVLFLATLSLTSCLKKADMNIDPEKLTGNIMELQFIKSSGSTINSGMQYFAGGALTYPGSDDFDTAHYNISLAGPPTLSKDLTVTVGVDASKVLDNFNSDSIKYELMPDSLYHFVETTAIIKAGERIAPMHIAFYPSKIDVTKSYMLPVVIKEAAGQIISGNFATIYFHVIGNPIAGAYLWDFIRYNTQDGSGPLSSASFLNLSTVFSPVDPTSVKVPTGYYVQPDYLITFTNTGGVLSDFKAEIAPDEVTAAFTNNGITITSAPTINVSPDLKTFTIKYTVFNGSDYRNCTDIYHKP